MIHHCRRWKRFHNLGSIRVQQQLSRSSFSLISIILNLPVVTSTIDVSAVVPIRNHRCQHPISKSSCQKNPLTKRFVFVTVHIHRQPKNVHVFIVWGFAVPQKIQCVEAQGLVDATSDVRSHLKRKAPFFILQSCCIKHTLNHAPMSLM